MFELGGWPLTGIVIYTIRVCIKLGNSRSSGVPTPWVRFGTWTSLRRSQSLQVCRILLSDASLLALDEHGATALHEASAKGHAQVVDLLLERHLGGEKRVPEIQTEFLLSVWVIWGSGSVGTRI